MRVCNIVIFDVIFPARAGMIPESALPFVVPISIPRESGDDPVFAVVVAATEQYSPRERG